MFGKKKKQCPKCDSTDLNVVKPSFRTKLFQPLVGNFRKFNLNVCRSCGFSWEDR